MGLLKFTNNASTTLSGSINNSQTLVTVANSSGFPALAAGEYFYATMYETSGNPAVEINIEIVKVTATSGNNWTIVRAQDGTSARSRDGVTTCYIELRLTAAGANEMLQIGNNLSDLGSASTARTNLGLGTMATQSAASVAITGGTISGVTLSTLDSTTTIADNADPTKKVAFEISSVATATTRTLTVPNADGTIALTSNLSSYQPLDSDLTAVAGLAANGLIARTGTGTMAVRSIAQPVAGITVTNGDGVSGNPTLALANDLLGVESIATTGFVRRTAADTWSASAIVDGDLPSALTGKTYNGITPTANATGFSLAGGTTSKTLTVNNSITLAGTDGTTITFPTSSGTLPLNNQTFFIGTTSVAINRASASLSLTGVNIDGSAGTATSATTATTATNLASGVLGSLPYQSAAATTALLAPNTTTTRNFLRMTGTGAAGAAPAWDTVTKTDVGLANVENTALSTWAGSANITTLGTVATGTWNATTISIAKGGTGQTTAVAAFDALSPATTLGDVIFHNGTDNVRLAGNTTTNRRFLRQTGTGTVSAAPAWDGLLNGDIPTALTGKTYNALTLTAEATGFTVAGGTTSKTLTVSNTLTFAGTDASTLNIGAGGTLGSAAFTASTDYAPAAGSSSITTVGTIGSGTWQGGAIGISYGGTGAATKAAGFNALSPVTTLGDLIYGDGANSNARLAGNTTASKLFLTQTGTGSVSAAPGWNALVNGDIPSALTGKTYNGLTLTANATGFQIAGGTTSKTLAISNNLTLAGTDGTTMTFPSTSQTVAALGVAQTFTAVQTLTPAARTSGVASYFTLTTPADTGQTASTESIGANFTAATRTWAAGALTLQRERVFAAPTYAFASASTLTTAVNVDIAAPIAGANATITNAYALRAAASQFTGAVNLNALTASTALALDANKNVVSVTNTGSGNNVLATSPTLTTPTLGVATATSVNKVAITAPATSATLTIADGKTLTASNTLTFSGTDGSTLNVGAGGTLGSAAYTASTAYQPVDADLTAIATLAGTSGFLKKTAADTWTLDTNAYLTGNQSISVTGDATGSGTTSIALTLASVGTAGTYRSVTTDAKGRVTAGTNPTTLSGYGIVDAQPLDADLTAIAGLAGTSGFLKKTATDTWSLDTTTYLTGNQSITLSGDASGTGTTAISVTLANSGVTAGTYNDSATAVRPFTVDGKGRITSIGTAVTITPAFSSLTSKPTTISGYGITDAYTKTEVDNLVSGLDFKASVRAASTANLTLSGTQTVDGVVLIAGDRVLVKNQTTGSENGIYAVASGVWTRTPDADASADVTSGMYVFVEEGTTNADSGWVLATNNPITLNTTALTFTQFNGLGQITAGAGLTKTGNTLDVATASTARIVVNADSIDLATAGTAGTYRSVTTDAYGRVTAGTNPTTLSGYGITDAAPRASPALTGTPTSTTAALDTNTTQIATTAFVVGQAASATPLVNGTAAVGTSLRYARGDHVHGTDTSRAPLASPTFTGTPAAPTAAVDTNTTQLATTAYVVGQGYLKATSAASTYAPLASPALTGTPTAPTAAVDTNTTQLATTAYVVGQGYLKSAAAASTYQTQAGMSSYLTTASAASTYLALAGGTLTGNLITSAADIYVGAAAKLGTNARTFTVSAGATGDSVSGIELQGSRTGTGNNFASADFYHQADRVASITAFRREADAGGLRVWTKSTGGSLTERFQVNDFGAIGLSGDVYGTSGQALLSAGSTAAPTWGDVATPTGTQTLTNKTISGGVYSGTVDQTGSVRGGITAVAALDIDCSAGNYFTKTINGASTFTFSNAPASRAYAFTLELTHTSGTVTWPTTVRWPGSSAPSLTISRIHLFTFVTDDGGTIWRGTSNINYATT